MSEIIEVKNSMVALGRTAELIAAEINDIKERTRKQVLYNSIEIGRRLVEAKELVPFGEWGEWLEKSVEYSKSTANNLMNIFNEYGSAQMSLLYEDNAKSQAFGNLSYSQAVALLGIPSEEREDFIKENNVEELSSRELKKLIKERDEALKKAEELKKTADKNSEMALRAKNELKEVKEKLKNEKAEFEKERQTLYRTVDDISKKLKEAEALGDNAEVERLNDSLSITMSELDKANEKIKDLEEEIQAKPMPIAIKEIPEDVKKELEELRAKVNQEANKSEAKMKFKIIFDSLVDQFNKLLNTIDEVASEDKEKYKKATSGLLSNMLESL